MAITISETKLKNTILTEIHSVAAKLRSIEKFIEKYTDGFDRWNESDPQEIYIRDMLYKIGDKSSEIYSIIKRITQSIICEGILVKNLQGNYEIEGTGYYFASGQSIEILIPEDDYGPAYWVSTRIEFSHDPEWNDYYAVGYKKFRLDGLKARVKEN